MDLTTRWTTRLKILLQVAHLEGINWIEILKRNNALR
jgi:hypothetical protein